MKTTRDVKPRDDWLGPLPYPLEILNDLRMAVDYKVAMNRIIQLMPPMGRMNYDEWFWYYSRKRLSDRDPDFDAKHATSARKIEARYPEYAHVPATIDKISHRVRLTAPSVGFNSDYVDDAKFLKANTISVGCCETPAAIFTLNRLSKDGLATIYEIMAKPVKFGHRSDLRTEFHNQPARRLREVPHTEISDGIAETVKAFWIKTFGQTQINVSVQKVALYGKGDFCASHLATPEPGLIGTVLFGLSGSPTPGTFIIGGIPWSSNLGSMCGFYADVEYSVCAASDSCRGVIEFHIHAQCEGPSTRIKESEPMVYLDTGVAKSYRDAARAVAPAIAWIVQGCPLPFPSEEVDDNRQYIAKDRDDDDDTRIEAFRELDPDTVQVGRPFGWLLSHGYSLLEKDLMGQDRVFVEAIRQFPNVVYEIHPVLRHFHAFEGDSTLTDYLVKHVVYPITPAHIAFVMNRGACPESIFGSDGDSDSRNVPSFWAPNMTYDFCWDMHINGSLEESALHVGRAIVVKSWGTATPPSPKNAVGPPPRKRPRLDQPKSPNPAL